MNAEEVREWLKRHWLVLAGVGGGLVVVLWYLWHQNSSSQQSTASVPYSVPSASGSTSGGSGGSTPIPDMSALSNSLQQAMQDASNALSTQVQQAQQALQSQSQQEQASIAALMQQEQAASQQQIQQEQAVNQSYLQKLQQAGSSATSQLQSALAQAIASLQTQQGVQPASANQASVPYSPQTSISSAAATFAKNLGIPEEWAQQYLNSGHTASEPLSTLQAWLNSMGYRNPSTGALNLISPAVQAAGSRYGAYVPGNQPASPQHPAGGGLWNGMSDTQIQQLFQRTYGSNWQTVWQQQHQAALAKYGQ